MWRVDRHRSERHDLGARALRQPPVQEVRRGPDGSSEMNQEEVLTLSEAKKLILALNRTRGNFGFTEAEADKLLIWARQQRIAAALLDAVLEGLIAVDVRPDGEVVLNEPST